MTNTTTDAKIALRATAKAARAAARQTHGTPGPDEALARHGLALLAGLESAPGDRVVTGFLPIGEEIDPVPLLAGLIAAGWRAALPVMVGKARPLIFRSWTPGDALAERMWGIREPLTAAPELAPDVLLVPLLAFDAAGWRLGYGGGFYDRTLAGLRAVRPVVAVGLAFDEQRVDAVPHLDYDQRLDWVLTPSGPLRCIER